MVDTSINNNRETTVISAASGSLDNDHKALRTGIFNNKNSAFAKTPHYAGGQNIQARRAGNCFNCGKTGNYARECRSAPNQSGPQQNGQRNNNKNKQYAHKLSAIAEDNDAVVDEDTEEGAVGYTSNNINIVPSCGVN